MNNAFSLHNQTALITGGGTGIGKAIAQCMAEAGAAVLLVGRRQEVLKQACKDIGDRAAYLVYDVTCTDNVETFCRQVYERVGTPDILVHNAGIHLKKEAAHTTSEEILAVFNTHVFGACALTRAFMPSFIERGSGSIVFITSMAAVFGIPEVSAYAAAKSSLLGLVRTYATELSPKGIRVNAVAPGWIQTAMMEHALESDSQREQRILSRTPLRCFGAPEDIGWAAVYLCSPAARFVTGQQLVVDGGVSIGF